MCGVFVCVCVCVCGVCVCVCVGYIMCESEFGLIVGDERGGAIKVRPTVHQKVTDKNFLTEMESAIK